MNIKASRPYGFSFLATAFMLGLLTQLSGCGGGSGEAAAPAAAAALAVSPTTASGSSGQTLNFVVTGGSPSYTVASSNPSLATVSAVASNGSQYIFTAPLLGAGTVVFTITDSKGATTSATATVTASAAASLITSAPSSVTIGAGAIYQQSYTIGGGTAPYTATSANTSIATVASNGSVVTITGVSRGTTDVLVKDATGAASVTITVNVATTGTGFTVTGNAIWTINGNSDGNLNNDCSAGVPAYNMYYINGGIPPYTVSSTSPLIGTVLSAVPTAAVATSSASITVAASGGSFVVAWPNSPCFGDGTATIQVTDSTGTIVSPAPTFQVTWTPS